jgi:hypothetical protein
LRGLKSKSTNDLTNIEEMLLHLLSEVEALRAAQEGRPLRTDTENTNSPARSQADITPTPENRNGLSSHPPTNSGDARVLHSQGGDSGRRISPVLERDEEPLTPQEQRALNAQMAVDAQVVSRHTRGGSVPLRTPERVPVAAGAVSTETTPKTSNEKARKHKSSSSSFFPKISRWSKTTASSMGSNLRNTVQSGRRERPSSEMSRSGSDLDMYANGEFYDPQGDDRLRSNNSLANEKRENRPPSPLVPSQISEAPRYRAHRDSLNLQHPQPRQGPTARYQNQLESEAQYFAPFASPKSEAWASNPTLTAVQADGARRHRSPMSDGSHSVASSVTSRQNAPPRPPKIRDDGPLVPQRPANAADGGQQNYSERAAMRETGRPATSRAVRPIPASSFLSIPSVFP